MADMRNRDIYNRMRRDSNPFLHLLRLEVFAASVSGHRIEWKKSKNLEDEKKYKRTEADNRTTQQDLISYSTSSCFSRLITLSASFIVFDPIEPCLASSDVISLSSFQSNFLSSCLTSVTNIMKSFQSRSTSSSSSRMNYNNRLMVSCLVLGIILSCICLSSGRYLPTRSDNSRRERIKDVLRLVSLTIITIIVEKRSKFPSFFSDVQSSLNNHLYP